MLYCGISRLERSQELDAVYRRLVDYLPFLACSLAGNALAIPGFVVVTSGDVSVTIVPREIQLQDRKCSSGELSLGFFRLKAEGTIVCPVNHEVKEFRNGRLRFVEDSQSSVERVLTPGEAALRLIQLVGDLIHPAAAMSYFSPFLECMSDIRIVGEPA